MTTPHILLTETAEGAVVGVRFADSDAARAWADAHEDAVLDVGCIPIVSRTEALRLGTR
jgi:hypothetical protein